MKYVALLDCNNFFVSCERLFRPDLINRPVVVLSSNDGCVVARSKEIKDMGIPMGVPYFQIKDILKESKAVVFSSHFSLYRDISRRVFEVVRTQFDDIEQYSIDECFFAFESDQPEQVALTLKRQVERLVGIPVSVGVSLSKTQAKYASSVAKRTDGVAVWNNETWKLNYDKVNLSELWGVGAGTSRKFSEHSLRTVADLIKTENSQLGMLFGVEGLRLKEEMLGHQVFDIKSFRSPQKSVMSTRSFAVTSTDMTVLTDAITYHLYQGVKDLEMMDLLTTSLRVMISPGRHSDYVFYSASKEATLANPTRDIFTLQKVAMELLKACYKPNIPYKKAGIILSSLVEPESVTPSLFLENTKESSTNQLTKTILSINQKHGKALIQLGRTEYTKKNWLTKKDLLSPSYSTSWSELKTVRS